ncbi:DUF4209 domain-containing protein [Flavobacterium sp. Arc3]|uniref:DUF4209 domain-containing protein n=1 Tax=Flavobacterium sp. Arc3 TaxID=3046686 RepID=UPI00352D9A61
MFNTLEEYYTYLNEDNFFKTDIGLSSNLKPLQDKLISEEEKKNCTIEICFNNFNFKKGTYVPLFSLGSYCSPDLEAFDDLEYLKQRTLNCINPKFKSKYFHLLYHKTNDKRDAIEAINTYFDLLENTELDLFDNLEIRGFINVFDNLIYLVEKVKYKQNEVIQFVKYKIQQDKIKGFSFFHIIDFVSNNMKLKTDSKQFFFDVVEAEISAIKYPEHRVDFIKLIIGLAQKIGKSQQEYQNLLGDYYLDEAKKEGESFYVHNIYLEALNIFKKAGNKSKQDEVSKLIQDSKNSIKLGKMETKFESPFIDKYFKSMDKHTTELTENNSSDIVYQYITVAKKIFPKASILEEFTKPTTFDLVTTITFDKNKNISVNNSKGINSYQTYFQLFSKEHLEQVFLKGQSSGKITFESLKEFLENNTWYNDVNVIINPDGKDYSFKWIDFILPPLKLFFEQSEKDFENNSHTPEGYILAIDSLCLKFEGVLRDFSNKIGAQIIEGDTSKTEMRVSFDNLFDNEKFTKIIPEDDVAFFKFLFTSKGINLRNNVAHSFYAPKDYSVSMIWMLICAFLKLGNFKFK